MKLKDGGRRLKSVREVYEETRLRLGCHMFVLDNRWIKEAWKQEARKGCNSIKDKIILTMQAKSKTVQSEGEDMELEEKILDREFKPIQKQVKKNASKRQQEKKTQTVQKMPRKCKVKQEKKKCKVK